MAFFMSPGVLVVERDLTNSIPAVATSIGGYAGAFQWGPVLDPLTIGSELELVKTFGKPNSEVAASFFSASNFLGYSNNLKVVRNVGTLAKNAVDVQSGTVTDIDISAGGSGYSGTATVVIGAPDDPSGVQAVATATIGGGAITAITITNPGSGYLSAPAASITGNGTGATLVATVTLAGALVKNETHWEDNFSAGEGVHGLWAAKYPGELGNSILVSIADSASYAAWDYKDNFEEAPGTSAFAADLQGTDDELHIIVVDAGGLLTGVPGTILETWAHVSKASNAKTEAGANNYYKEVLRGSKYIWWMDHPTAGLTGTAAWGSTASSAFKTLDDAYTVTLSGGVDDNVLTDGEVQAGFDLFANANLIDVNLLFIGPASLAVGKYVIENIAEVRKDCIVFVSPSLAAVYNNQGDEADDIVDERVDASFNVNSSYGVMDDNWKKQYDKYNDTFRWVPLNPDVAGLCARTDTTNDPWWSPAGYNRGQVKNVHQLAWSAEDADRDTLFSKGINSVITTRGQGTLLYGDKTLLAKPSAFDAINVRRLFIVLEKAIAIAAKFMLFEFNDNFTRAQFRSMVEPFLRDVQGRRGIYEFHVVCDTSNNTGEVIDRNEFVGDIYIKPARAIRNIKLNFIATRTGVSFEEIIGASN
jgi:hypothetical protein